MCCCCWRLHRHQIHLISYGCVSFGLITTGLVFTVFAIFQKESQIGKVWLAGPTTMVVGLVLCGKVMIDWGPAMMHAREGSIDSRLEDLAQQMMMKGPQNPAYGIAMPADMDGRMVPMGMNHSPIPAMSAMNNAHQPLFFANCNVTSPCPPRRNGTLPHPHRGEPVDCIIYGNYETPHGSSGGETVSVHPSTHTSSSATIVSPEHSVNEMCDCRYGAMRKPPPHSRTLYQGESFVVNERSFLI